MDMEILKYFYRFSSAGKIFSIKSWYFGSFEGKKKLACVKLRRFATMTIKYEINRQILDIFENLVNLKLVPHFHDQFLPQSRI